VVFSKQKSKLKTKNDREMIGILQGRLSPAINGQIQAFPHSSWEEEFFLAKKLGFDCIELLVKREGFLENPLFSRAGRKRIKDLGLEADIGIFSVHGFYNKDPDYVGILTRLIEFSAEVGARTLLISFFGENSLLRKEDWEVVRLIISSALSQCEENNVILGIETEIEAPQLLRFVEQFDNEHVGVYYDIGNMASFGVNISEEIKVLGQCICGVHVKDRLPKRLGTVPLGTGCADFREAFKSLREISYTGPLILQGARDPKKDDLTLNGEYLSFVRQILQKTHGELT